MDILLGMGKSLGLICLFLDLSRCPVTCERRLKSEDYPRGYEVSSMSRNHLQYPWDYFVASPCGSQMTSWLAGVIFSLLRNKLAWPLDCSGTNSCGPQTTSYEMRTISSGWLLVLSLSYSLVHYTCCSVMFWAGNLVFLLFLFLQKKTYYVQMWQVHLKVFYFQSGLSIWKLDQFGVWAGKGIYASVLPQVNRGKFKVSSQSIKLNKIIYLPPSGSARADSSFL